MGTYNVDVFGESTYDFDVELSTEELKGVLKVLGRCNEIGEFNDVLQLLIRLQMKIC